MEFKKHLKACFATAKELALGSQSFWRDEYARLLSYKAVAKTRSLADAKSRSTFRFLDLPPEIRNLIYGKSECMHACQVQLFLNLLQRSYSTPAAPAMPNCSQLANKSTKKQAQSYTGLIPSRFEFLILGFLLTVYAVAVTSQCGALVLLSCTLAVSCGRLFFYEHVRYTSTLRCYGWISVPELSRHACASFALVTSCSP